MVANQKKPDTSEKTFDNFLSHLNKNELIQLGLDATRLKRELDIIRTFINEVQGEEKSHNTTIILLGLVALQEAVFRRLKNES